MRYLNPPVCEGGSNSRLLKGLCLLFCPMVLPHYDKQYNRDKEKQWPSAWEKDQYKPTVLIYQISELHCHKELAAQIFSLSYLSGEREREKELSLLFFPPNLAGRDPGGCCGKKFYHLPALVRCPRVSQLWQLWGRGPTILLTGLPTVMGGEIHPSTPLEFLWLD